jgi:hypothetical protein
MQALEAIKLTLGLNCLKNKILIFNGIENKYMVKEIIKRKTVKLAI